MRLAILLLVITTLVGCDDGSGSGASDSGADGGPGVLLIARPDGIVEFNIEDGAEQTLLEPAANEFLLDPAVSPDGARLAYIVQPPPKIEGGVYDAGSDLWLARRDGSEPRLVFEHVDPNQLVRFPQWRDDNRLLAIVIETVRREGQTMVVYTLQEFDVATGARRTLREDVIAFAVSPDGERVVYAELAPTVGETLRTAPVEGGEPQTLVSIEDNLSPFASPDYSPDGRRVAFASADQSGVRAGMRYVSLPAAAATDGLPQDIWVIDAEGGPVRRAADLNEDLPALTWSGDGQHIYVLGSNGLYDVGLQSGEVLRIGPGVFHGQLTWAEGR